VRGSGIEVLEFSFQISSGVLLLEMSSEKDRQLKPGANMPDNLAQKAFLSNFPGVHDGTLQSTSSARSTILCDIVETH
jgi:hypothetical protein